MIKNAITPYLIAASFWAHSVPLQSQETAADTTFWAGNFIEQPNYTRSVMYLEANLKNEKSLLKISIPVLNSGIKQIGYTQHPKYTYKYVSVELLLGFEHKLNASLSVYINNATVFRRADITGLHMLQKPAYFNQLYNALDIGSRYYFLMKSRIQQGLSGNNMQGSYLGAAVEGLSTIHVSPSIRYEPLSPDAFKVYLGLQNRLNSWAFFDISLYARMAPNVQNNNINTNYLYSLGINLKIGLAKTIAFIK